MKKVAVLLLCLVICLSLCGCQKTEAVKNVESLIDGIGQVTLESVEAVAEAEAAYEALTDKEKESVGNYEVLISAGEALEEVQQQHFEELRRRVIGEWKDETGLVEENLNFTEDGRFQVGSVAYGDTWELSEDGNDVYVNGWCSYTVIEENGITKLVNNRPFSFPYDGVLYVRPQDYEAAHNEKYVTVELTKENISEYMGEATFIGYELDDFGEEKTDTSCYAFPSLVHDQGLIYLGAKDAAIEVLLRDKDYHDYSFSWTLSEPFGSWGVLGYVSDWEEIVGLGRAQGEIVFVKEEYVSHINWTVSPYNGDIKSRNISLKNGTSFLIDSPFYVEQLIESRMKF